MSMLTITSLTRQMGRVCLKHPTPVIALRSSSLQASQEVISRSYYVSHKTLDSDKKKSSTRSAKQPKIPPQHQEWLSFQESIAVDGFESVTGGGSSAKEESVKEVEEERQRLTQAGGGLYPPLRWSPSETERLLREAYEHLPARAGPRRTRRDKRNFRRWQAVRKIRKKYKKQLVRHHERKMEERSRTIRLVKEELEAAPGLRQRDREYQARTLRRWAEIMTEDDGVEEPQKTEVKE